MRPGQAAPDELLGISLEDAAKEGFNEAGASSPG